VAASSGPPDRACTIHHRTDELLVEQHTVSDEQAASPVKEGAKHAQSLSCLLCYLVDVRRPGKLSIKSHPKIPCCFGLLYWLSEKLHCSGFLDASRYLNKAHISALKAVEPVYYIGHGTHRTVENGLDLSNRERRTRLPETTRAVARCARRSGDATYSSHSRQYCAIYRSHLNKHEMILC
jgi:hypothetical protein